jgi:hypothetical protein
VSSQTKIGNKKGDNGMRSTTQDLKIPIEITSYAMQSPDGAVTQVTEMLYDVPNNPFKIPTSTPIVSPIFPPSTMAVITATEDPRVTQTPYLNRGYSETEAGSFPIPPLDSAVTPKVDSITVSPIKFWTSQRSTTSTPVTTWTSQRSLPTPPPRLELSTAPSESGTRKLRKRISTQKPSTTTIRNIASESESGLSGAAIAGIVIGSMVSVMLLAGMKCKLTNYKLFICQLFSGTSLFVLYKNPFKRANIPQSSAYVENSLPNNIQTSDRNTTARVSYSYVYYIDVNKF